MTVDDAKMLKEKLTLLANVSGARLELSANTLQIKGKVCVTSAQQKHYYAKVLLWPGASTNRHASCSTQHVPFLFEALFGSFQRRRVVVWQFAAGPQDARIRANHFVHAVLDKGLPQGALRLQLRPSC